MTDTSTTPQRFHTGRRPIRPEGRRFAIRWLHEYDESVAPDAPVVYPVDVSQGIVNWGMLGNGPDPTLTIVTPNGPGQPVGNCFYVGKDHEKMLAGYKPTANLTVAQYDLYEASEQNVPLGQEQDQGVVVADALLWCLTHNELGAAVPVGQGDVQLFAPVHPATLGQVMAKYKRGILLGVNLTDQDQNTFPVWKETPANPPDPNEGHVVLLVVLNGPIGTPTGSGVPISWAQRVQADPPWLANCPEEWWIILTAADRALMGEVAFAALATDVAAIPGSTGSAPIPVPPPVVHPPVVPVPPVVHPPTPVPVRPAPPLPPPGGAIWLMELAAYYEHVTP
jgi:hypothetical protein